VYYNSNYGDANKYEKFDYLLDFLIHFPLFLDAGPKVLEED